MRVFLSIMAFLLTLAIVLGGAGFVWSYNNFNGKGPLSERKQVLIPRGQGLSGIADQLEQEGAIEHPYLFMAAAELSGKNKQLKAGEYDFQPNVPMRHVLDMMAKGSVLIRRVTVPEGLTSWQVVQVLNRTDGLSGEIAAIPAEGSLLPETYGFERGDSRTGMIARMQEARNKILDDLWKKRDSDSPVLSQSEAVILASIVEKETGVPAERKTVAGVFINRLRKGIPLQSDPTVIYALTGGKIQENGMGPLGRHLLSADLMFASPYNTYKNAGLPPGPIANPGAQSLEAVLNPEHNDYLYFVANGTGGHVFAKTLEEHNRNVAQWREMKKEGK